MATGRINIVTAYAQPCRGLLGLMQSDGTTGSCWLLTPAGEADGVSLAEAFGVEGGPLGIQAPIGSGGELTMVTARGLTRILGLSCPLGGGQSSRLGLHGAVAGDPTTGCVGSIQDIGGPERGGLGLRAHLSDQVAACPQEHKRP